MLVKSDLKEVVKFIRKIPLVRNTNLQENSPKSSSFTRSTIKWQCIHVENEEFNNERKFFSEQKRKEILYILDLTKNDIIRKMQIRNAQLKIFHSTS